MSNSVQLLLDFHKASELPFPFTPAWADALYMRAKTDPNWLCLERPGGILIALVTPSVLGPYLVAHEVAWWAPGSGRGMLEEYEKWAISKGAKVIEMKSFAKFPRSEILYKRAGYEKQETSWVKWRFSQA